MDPKGFRRLEEIHLPPDVAERAKIDQVHTLRFFEPAFTLEDVEQILEWLPFYEAKAEPRLRREA